MSDVARWLAALGLEKYGSAFTEAEIEFSDLPQLSAEDLKELGLPVGPRRRIQEAIKQLDGSPDSPAPDPQSPQQRVPQRKRPVPRSLKQSGVN